MQGDHCPVLLLGVLSFSRSKEESVMRGAVALEHPCPINASFDNGKRITDRLHCHGRPERLVKGVDDAVRSQCLLKRRSGNGVTMDSSRFASRDQAAIAPLPDIPIGFLDGSLDVSAEWFHANLPNTTVWSA